MKKDKTFYRIMEVTRVHDKVYSMRERLEAAGFHELAVFLGRRELALFKYEVNGNPYEVTELFGMPIVDVDTESHISVGVMVEDEENREWIIPPS